MTTTTDGAIIEVRLSLVLYDILLQWSARHPAFGLHEMYIRKTTAAQLAGLQKVAH